mgnify:FL=1|tara:strand:- start:126 stop:593 length:468 start_codon:yes stop_codon:yes gene_type:complete
MKSLKYLIVFIFFVSCGYTPIYQNDQISKFKLETINHTGDKKIGRELLNNLQRFKDNKSDDIFDLYLTSVKRENIVSKDKKGDPSSYKIELEVNLNLVGKNNDKKFSKKFMKGTTYNSSENNFELNRYKKKLEKNLTSQLLQEINNFFGVLQNDL